MGAITSLVDALLNGIKTLFVPSEGFLEEKVNSVKDKFSFVDSVKLTINDMTSIITNEENAPIFYVNVFDNKWGVEGKVKVVDLSFYAPYKEYGDTIICCFVYAFFFWRVFINLSNIISGAGGAIDGSMMVSDIQAYHRFGFGRRASMSSRQIVGKRSDMK